MNEKQVFSGKKSDLTTLSITNYLQQIEIPELVHMSAPCSQLPSNISTMSCRVNIKFHRRKYIIYGHFQNFRWIKLSTPSTWKKARQTIYRGLGKPQKKFFFSGMATKGVIVTTIKITFFCGFPYLQSYMQFISNFISVKINIYCFPNKCIWFDLILNIYIYFY